MNRLLLLLLCSALVASGFRKQRPPTNYRELVIPYENAVIGPRDYTDSYIRVPRRSETFQLDITGEDYDASYLDRSEKTGVLFLFRSSDISNRPDGVVFNNQKIYLKNITDDVYGMYFSLTDRKIPTFMLKMGPPRDNMTTDALSGEAFPGPNIELCGRHLELNESIPLSEIPEGQRFCIWTKRSENYKPVLFTVRNFESQARDSWIRLFVTSRQNALIEFLIRPYEVPEISYVVTSGRNFRIIAYFGFEGFRRNNLPVQNSGGESDAIGCKTTINPRQGETIRAPYALSDSGVPALCQFTLDTELMGAHKSFEIDATDQTSDNHGGLLMFKDNSIRRRGAVAVFAGEKKTLQLSGREFCAIYFSFGAKPPVEILLRNRATPLPNNDSELNQTQSNYACTGSLRVTDQRIILENLPIGTRICLWKTDVEVGKTYQIIAPALVHHTHGLLRIYDRKACNAEPKVSLPLSTRERSIQKSFSKSSIIVLLITTNHTPAMSDQFITFDNKNWTTEKTYD